MRKKLPLSELGPGEKIPEFFPNLDFTAQGFDEKFKIYTDVVETGRIRFAALNTHVRPVPGGYSVGILNSSIRTGTHGAWLEDKRQGIIGISNNHVVADFNRTQRNFTKIIQPGSFDDPVTNSNIIGTLSDFVDLRPNTLPGDENNVDFAFYKPGNQNLVDRQMHNSGIIPTGVAMLDQPVQIESRPRVFKYGRSTEYTKGFVNAIDAFVRTFDENGNEYWFRNQIELDMDINDGDSGACLLQYNSNRICGLIFAKAELEHKAYANHFTKIIEEAGLDLIF